jgi:hypothetical protein
VIWFLALNRKYCWRMTAFAWAAIDAAGTAHPRHPEIPVRALSTFEPRHFPLTLDLVTGMVTRPTPGGDFDGDIRAGCHPDEAGP